MREGLFIRLLGDLCSTPAAVAMTISLTTYAVLIAWSAVGGVFYLFYRPTRQTVPSEVQEHERAA